MKRKLSHFACILTLVDLLKTENIISYHVIHMPHIICSISYGPYAMNIVKRVPDNTITSDPNGTDYTAPRGLLARLVKLGHFLNRLH